MLTNLFIAFALTFYIMDKMVVLDAQITYQFCGFGLYLFTFASGDVRCIWAGIDDSVTFLSDLRHLTLINR